MCDTKCLPRAVRPRESARACTHRRAHTRMLACQWAERCHSVPSPHVGEGQGGGYSKQRPCLRSETQSPHSRYLEPAQDMLRTVCFVATPLPVPPPHGGREPCGTHLRNSRPAQFEICACPRARAGTTGESAGTTAERPRSPFRHSLFGPPFRQLQSWAPFGIACGLTAAWPAAQRMRV